MDCFDERVFKLVRRIPIGKVATYGQIADLLGAFGAARQVGWTLARLPLPSNIPWHRVVNAQGRVSMSSNRLGSDFMQVDLLRLEGVEVDIQGSLPLKEYLWSPEPLDQSN